MADVELLGRVPGPDVPAALRLATELDPVALSLRDRPWEYLSALATLGAVDLTAARTAEPHLLGHGREKVLNGSDTADVEHLAAFRI